MTWKSGECTSYIGNRSVLTCFSAANKTSLSTCLSIQNPSRSQMIEGAYSIFYDRIAARGRSCQENPAPDLEDTVAHCKRLHSATHLASQLMEDTSCTIVTGEVMCSECLGWSRSRAGRFVNPIDKRLFTRT